MAIVNNGLEGLQKNMEKLSRGRCGGQLEEAK